MKLASDAHFAAVQSLPRELVEHGARAGNSLALSWLTLELAIVIYMSEIDASTKINVATGWQRALIKSFAVDEL